MIWKHEAMEKLKQYEARRQAMNNIPAEIKRLELDMQSIRSADPNSPPVKGGGAGWEDVMLNNIAHRQELDNAMAQTKIWVSVVENALSTLTPEEYLLLDRFYINPEKKAADKVDAMRELAATMQEKGKTDQASKFMGALRGALADVLADLEGGAA